jgi:hypothetical protein
VREHDDARVRLVRVHGCDGCAAEGFVAPDGGGSHGVQVVGHNHAHVGHLQRVAEGAQAGRGQALQDAQRTGLRLRLGRLGRLVALRSLALSAALLTAGRSALLALRRRLLRLLLFLFVRQVSLRLLVGGRHAGAQLLQQLRRVHQQRHERRVEVQRAHRVVAQPPRLRRRASRSLLAATLLEQAQHRDGQVAVHNLAECGVRGCVSATVCACIARGARGGSARGGPSSRRAQRTPRRARHARSAAARGAHLRLVVEHVIVALQNLSLALAQDAVTARRKPGAMRRGMRQRARCDAAAAWRKRARCHAMQRTTRHCCVARARAHPSGTVRPSMRAASAALAASASARAAARRSTARGKGKRLHAHSIHGPADRLARADAQPRAWERGSARGVRVRAMSWRALAHHSSAQSPKRLLLLLA